jgi:predicted transcriptional regulator
MDELNNLSALSFVSTTNHTNSLQKELVDETSRAAVVETALTAELNNYQDRFAQLTLDYFRSLATTTQDWWARIDSLSDANYIQLVQTNMSWHEIFDSLNVIYATSLIKHTSATTALQNELITEVSTNVMSRIEERIINQEKLDEATEQGKMTANELELKTDRLNQAKDRISMQSDDLVGFMERRRELRDRMHNVSSVVKDWRSKIRNAGSSLLLAQQTKSKNYGKAHKSESILAGAGGRFLSRDLERTYNMYNYSRGEFNKILPI